MDKNFTYDEIIFKMGYFRTKNKVSKRDTSLALNHSCSFVNKLECKNTRLRVETLLEFMEYFNITPMEFFYPYPEKYNEDKEILEMISGLSDENKDFVKEVIRKIR